MGDTTGFHHRHSTQSTKVLFIDSKDATQQHQGETTHFTYVFRDSIIVQNNEGVLLSLLQASIPYSFYNVHKGVNDTIDVIVSQVTNPTYHHKAIVMEPGNYTAITLASTFKSHLESFLSSSTVNLPSIVTIDYNRDTQKFNFSINANGTHTGRRVIFNLSHGNNKNTHFDVELGFDSDTARQSVYFEVNSSNQQAAGSVSIVDESPTTISPIPNATKLVSNNIADLNGSVHSLYLRTNLPVLSTMDSMTGGQSNIVAKIPINTGPGGIIFHEPRDSVHKSLIHTRAIKALEIRITDDRNRVVSLNGLHFSLALLLEFVTIRKNILPFDPRITNLMLGFLRGDHKKNILNRYNTNEPTEPTDRGNSRNGQLQTGSRPKKIRKPKRRAPKLNKNKT